MCDSRVGVAVVCRLCNKYPVCGTCGDGTLVCFAGCVGSYVLQFADIHMEQVISLEM